jgi:hypothetical protein
MKTKNNKIKSVEYWTRKEFEALPERKWDEEIGEFNSLIILPKRRLHDSGYRMMDFIAVVGNIPKCRLSGCSDVIHFDGIGGLGYKWIDKEINDGMVPAKDWCIDCLRTSGLLRIFSANKMICGPSLSSFELYSLKDKKQGNTNYPPTSK